MTPTTRCIVLAALVQYRGDDYARATAAFRNCSPRQLDEQYGQSGKTKRQILEEYHAHVTSVDQAIAEIALEQA